jgi:hypothetical protein
VTVGTVRHPCIWGRGIAPLRDPSYQRPCGLDPSSLAEAISRERIAASPCNGFSPSPTTTMAPCPWGSRPVGHPTFRWCCTYERDVGAPFISFNVLAAHRPSCEEYAPRNLDGTLMMAPQPGVVAASVKFHRWRLRFGQSSSHPIARVSQDDTVHAFP